MNAQTRRLAWVTLALTACTAAPGAPVVFVEGTPEPARVEAGGIALDCRLVPLGR